MIRRLLAVTALVVAIGASLAMADEPDTMRFAMSGRYPPFSFVGDTGEVVGFDVDVAEAIARELGKDVDIVTTEWDGILTGLLGGRYHAIIGSMSITPARARQVTFSEPYYHSGAQLFIHADRQDEIKGIKDCDGKRIAAVVGETYEHFLRENHPSVKVVTYDDTDIIFRELNSGRIDGFVSDRLVGAWQAKAAKMPFIPAGDMLYSERIAIPVRPQDTELLEQINLALERMHANGEMDRLFDKWFGLDARSISRGMTAGGIAKLLGKGFAITLLVAGLSLIIGFAAAIPLGVILNRGASVAGKIVRACVDFIRGTPVLIQLLFVYLGLPLIGLPMGSVSAAIVTLSINSAAYMSEVVRSGLMSVDPGQKLAGRAIGLSSGQVFGLVVWPQAFRIAMPPLMNSVVALIKDTALVSVIAVSELISSMRSIVSVTYNPVWYLVAAGMFFAVTLPLMKMASRMEAKMKARGFGHD